MNCKARMCSFMSVQALEVLQMSLTLCAVRENNSGPQLESYTPFVSACTRADKHLISRYLNTKIFITSLRRRKKSQTEERDLLAVYLCRSHRRLNSMEHM